MIKALDNSEVIEIYQKLVGIEWLKFPVLGMRSRVYISGSADMEQTGYIVTNPEAGDLLISNLKNEEDMIKSIKSYVLGAIKSKFFAFTSDHCVSLTNIKNWIPKGCSA